jgi:hypothetical protein
MAIRERKIKALSFVPRKTIHAVADGACGVKILGDVWIVKVTFGYEKNAGRIVDIG